MKTTGQIPIVLLACLAAVLPGAAAPTAPPDDGVAPSAMDSTERISSAAERAARAAVARRVSAPDRFEIVSYRFGGADPLPPGALSLELLDADGPNLSGIMRLTFKALVDGVPHGVARAALRGVIRGPALVAAGTLTRGQPIAAQSVEVADVNLTRLRDEPLRSADEIDARVPVRSLGRGRVLTPALLQAAAVVRRGEIVHLRFRRSGLTVTARGTVTRDAAPGEAVTAVNTATGVRVVGLVLPDGSIEVERGAASGSKR